MICPECGVQMNHHAMKLDHSLSDAGTDDAFGAALLEVHECPECGQTELRKA